MAKIDITYIHLIKTILNEGAEYTDLSRGSTKRLQIPSYTFRHDLRDGFPALTVKELNWPSVRNELYWFMNGKTNVRELKSNIWNKDAYNFFLMSKPGYEMTAEEFYAALKLPECPAPQNGYEFGDCGKNYSHQWRRFNGEVDQLHNIVEQMRKDIMNTRMIVTAWNPSEINQTALPPCHYGFQVVGVPLPNGKFGFELHWDQRSVDVFLGLGFNIASYALMAHKLELLTGYQALAIQGALKCVHLYDNSFEAARKIIARDPYLYGNCTLDYAFPNRGNALRKDILTGSLDEFLKNISPAQFKLFGYESYPPERVEMLAPVIVDPSILCSKPLAVAINILVARDLGYLPLYVDLALKILTEKAAAIALFEDGMFKEAQSCRKWVADRGFKRKAIELSIEYATKYNVEKPIIAKI
jgi:thymidylate synthase